MIRSFPDLEFVGLDRGAGNGTPAEAAGHVVGAIPAEAVVGVPSQGSQSKLNTTKIRTALLEVVVEVGRLGVGCCSAQLRGPGSSASQGPSI